MTELLTVTDANAEAAATRAAAALAEGALVVLPTETVYGLAADARRPDALARIYGAKRRDAGKPVAFLAADVAAVEAAGAVLSPPARALAARFWPGALTLVLPCGEGFEGFRVPDHALALDIVRRCGGLLRATSANLSGEPAALTAGEALRTLGDAVELALDAGPVTGGEASTVVRVAGDRIEILRQGPLSSAELEAAAQAGAA